MTSTHSMVTRSSLWPFLEPRLQLTASWGSLALPTQSWCMVFLFAYLWAALSVEILVKKFASVNQLQDNINFVSSLLLLQFFFGKLQFWAMQKQQAPKINTISSKERKMKNKFKLKERGRHCWMGDLLGGQVRGSNFRFINNLAIIKKGVYGKRQRSNRRL